MQLKSKERVQQLGQKLSTMKMTLDLFGVTAEVVLVMDISGSMSGRFSSGEVQDIVERGLGLGLAMDDDGAIQHFDFGERATFVGDVGIDDIDGYVKKHMRTTNYEYGTNYATVIELIGERYFAAELGAAKGGYSGRGKKAPQVKAPRKHPVFVLFVTDGNCGDRAKTIEALAKLNQLPMFIQFCGVGGAKFTFLEDLDDIGNTDKRFAIDSAGFFEARSVKGLSDEDFYKQLLNEFPGWVKIVKAKGWIQ